MRPIDYTKALWENQQKKMEELERDLGKISASYLRIRGLIPGAYDTPHAPSIDQIYHTTEAALAKFIKDHVRD